MSFVEQLGTIIQEKLEKEKKKKKARGKKKIEIIAEIQQPWIRAPSAAHCILAPEAVFKPGLPLRLFQNNRSHHR